MRILVTRPRGQAEETAARLAARGHEAIVAPVLSIVATGIAPPLGSFDAILVTSRNAVPALALLRERFASTPVSAVGARTAAALEEAGFQDVAYAAGDAASLAALVADRLPPGTGLLHAAGQEGRPEPAASLRAAGYEVVTWEVYAAEAATCLPQPGHQALAEGSLDAILHYSPRSAAIVDRLAQQAGLGGPFAAMFHVCLSPSVAAGLSERPGRLAIADEPSENRLLDLLDEDAWRAD